ncbi:7829_t:CDS:2 [Entrophospora sp. SA101]|nr:7829_t:CDS:2 [Entrophospora sp. SA101]CAJ0905321.1 3494_t:CDS:2 [Entrophospora sp. SA101]
MLLVTLIVDVDVEVVGVKTIIAHAQEFSHSSLFCEFDVMGFTISSNDANIVIVCSNLAYLEV